MDSYMQKQQNSSWKKAKDVLPALFAVAALYFVMESFGITCPIKFITGISCAGCGMSRAWIAFLHLDIQKAFAYHPLFLTPPIFLIVWLGKKRISEKFYKNFIFTMIVLYVSVYLVRLVIGRNDIVVFRPKDGLIFRMISWIT